MRRFRDEGEPRRARDTYRQIARNVPVGTTTIAQALLMLDDFKFSLNTAVLQEMQRSTSWRWPAQERFGQHHALQFTGPGTDRITLPGTIYPDVRWGAGQVDALRALAARGKPLRLVASNGMRMRALQRSAPIHPQGKSRNAEL